MVRKILFFICHVGIIVGLATCSSSDGGSSSSDSDSAGAAVAALFSSGSGSSLVLSQGTASSLSALGHKNQASDDDEEDAGDGGGAGERNTCDDPDGDGNSDGPEEIDTPLSGTPGTYGDAVGGRSITMDEDDFCQDSEGNDNTGEGPDGNGRLASFTLSSEVTGTCTGADGSESTVTMESGTGVWRNTDDSFPEVYGTFVFDGAEMDCTIFLNEDQTVRVGSCSSSGSAVSLDSEASCRFSADGEGEDDEDTEGDEGDEEEIGEDGEDVD